MMNNFCKHGHDKDVTGVNYRGICKVCIQISKSKSSLKHRDKLNEEKRQFYQLNKSKIQAKQAIYRDTHKQELKEKKHEYYLVHREATLKKTHEYYDMKYASDPNFKLKARLRHRIRMALKGNAKRGSAVRDLGCSIPEFRVYIESKFYGTMSWSNWGDVWELDHIKPFKDFDLTDRDQLLKVVHYTNYQPLTIEDHRKKTSQDLSK
jgi:hypothetical protein